MAVFVRFGRNTARVQLSWGGEGEGGDMVRCRYSVLAEDSCERVLKPPKTWWDAPARFGGHNTVFSRFMEQDECGI